MKLSKKQFFPVLLAIVLIVAGYLLALAVFPKNANRYPFLIFLLLIDFYVWGMFKQKFFTYNKFLKSFLVAIYWFPMAALAAATLITFAFRQYDWLPWVRNLVYGSIFTFYVAKFFMAILLFFADIVKWLTGFINWMRFSRGKTHHPGSRKYKRSEFLQQMALITGGLVVTTMFTGMFRWVHRFDIKRLIINLNGLPEAFSGFRVVQISDLHLGSWSDIEALEEAFDDILNANPDVIVFTGDLVNYTTDEANRFKKTLKRLTAPYGVYAILGNHDYGDYVRWPNETDKKHNLEELFKLYEDSGWTLLRNSSAIISKGDDRLAIVGVENWSANARFPRKGKLDKALIGLEQIPAKILLSHDPSHWSAQVIDYPVEIGLTLSGHTHGFQFGIEIPGFKWSPAQYVYRHWAGLYESDSKKYLYVNRGLGSIGYPGRIGILPEITLIELYPSNNRL